MINSTNIIFPAEITTQVRYLDFDSEIFGFHVARILPAKLSFTELQNILEILHAKQIRLVYWSSDTQDNASQAAAQKLHGFLGSEQITYIKDISTLDKTTLRFPFIKAYQASTPTMEMEQLAFMLGNYSRFNMDPTFPKNLINEIYKRWIANSCNKSVADAVFTIEDAGKVVAMITLDRKNNRGDIGLLAVNPTYRGRHYGEALVKTGQLYFLEQGERWMQIVTQKANIPACKLYEKCGYVCEKVENIYHFWLQA